LFALFIFDIKLKQKQENITDWALNQFQTPYNQANGATITKQDIFYYTYAVLHAPQYRRKYEQNLKREFPRLPFYADFAQWRDWGRELMDLHINYETVEPFDLLRVDRVETTCEGMIPSQKQNKLFAPDDSSSDNSEKTFKAKPKTKLRAHKDENSIEIDSDTILSGIPALAWEYKLGNRSALEWILDQCKEKKPQDATIAERFNTYKFEDYKEQVIDLLKRVTTVGIKTMEIVNQMPQE
jgi:predicted helicase